MEALQSGKYFLSCDWGTSNFRLQLIDIEKLLPIAFATSAEGIAHVYASWQQEGGDRFNFYTTVLQKHIAELETSTGFSLKDIPLVISGMASSTIGIKELPYKLMPFSVTGSDLEYEIAGKIIIISGARTGNDVMRGEETQVVGLGEALTGDEYIILPGTHSKHVTVKNGLAADVKTYMTGEVFQLLSQKSLLAGSIERTNNFEAYNNVFIDGIKFSRQNNFLYNIFSVRTNILLNKLSQEENYYFLSGLVIGEEIKNITGAKVHIVGSGAMNKLYISAINAMHPGIQINTVPAEQAIIRGQLKILRYSGLL